MLLYVCAVYFIKITGLDKVLDLTKKNVKVKLIF